MGSTRSTPLHLLFLATVGIAGLCALDLAPASAAWPSLTAAALFLAVIAGARAFAFPINAGSPGNLREDAEISLDSAIVIAATACLGPRVAAVGVAVLLTFDALLRGLGRNRPARKRDRARVVVHALYTGGLAGGLIALYARAFGIGIRAEPETVLVLALGVAFLVTHYLVQTLQLRLAGRSWRSAIRRNAIGIAAEATLLPLAGAIVLIWDAARPLPFALLGGTYLLVNFGFYRLAHLAAGMRRRALELETLNRTAHALGASLETPQLLAALLTESARALPQATRLEALLTQGTEVQRFVSGQPSPEPVAPGDYAARALLKIVGPVLEDDVQGEKAPRVRSRLAVPLRMYGETLGALYAESSDPDAFGPEELRLLDAIAGQAAAAVENARLYALANVDGLTGLYCRRYFDTRIAEELERARRFGSSFALIMLDLDDFKQLNDTLGHLAGDRALREVAAIAASQLRGVDLAARWGGEELAFLLPRTSVVDAHAVAERIREAIATHVITTDGQSRRITASLGVAGWAESEKDERASLVARADAALYRAKGAGKNRVEVDLVAFELTPSLAPVRRRRA